MSIVVGPPPMGCHSETSSLMKFLVRTQSDECPDADTQHVGYLPLILRAGYDHPPT